MHGCFVNNQFLDKHLKLFICTCATVYTWGNLWVFICLFLCLDAAVYTWAYLWMFILGSGCSCLYLGLPEDCYSWAWL
jgi:hypothetical protein